MAKLMNKHALSFNDILLVPQYSEIESRLNTDLSTKITQHLTINHPICSTNMSTVTSSGMLSAMAKTGSVGLLHRFMSMPTIIQKCISFKEHHPDAILIPSVGVKPEDYELVDALLTQVMPQAILIDIAHGDALHAYKMLSYIKKQNVKVDVIFGNLATGASAKRAVEAGADAVRMGIGGGSCCTTRTQTGHGVATLQSIADAYEVCAPHGIPVLGDGGFTTPGDIVKALAFGASAVTLGRMLAGTSAAPGKLFDVDGHKYKMMYGMSSLMAQDLHKGGMKQGIAAEGRAIQIVYQGHTEDVVADIVAAIRSGLTYSGAKTLTELREKAEYVIISAGGMRESKFFSEGV